MSDPYCGEIRIFAGSFAPANWALCDGSLIAISDYKTLFALVGTRYGGDGRLTFGLPDLRGRAPVSIGTSSAPPNSTYTLGQTGGLEAVTLTAANLPSHTHTFYAQNTTATQQSAQGRTSMLAGLKTSAGTGQGLYMSPAQPPPTLRALSPLSIPSSQPQSFPVDNVMPSIALNYIIALNGKFPQPA